MSKPFTRYIIFFLLAFTLISANIGGYSIYITDEARNAQCAYEMYERGDLIVPTFNGQLRTDKPPLHYYFMMIGYSILGKNPYAARIFSAIFGALLVIFTSYVGSKYISQKAGTWSAIVLLSSLGFITQFHLAVPDPYLLFFMCGGMLLYFISDQEKNTKFLYLAYVFIGLAVLAKGPVAIVLPGITLLIYIILTKRFNVKSILELKPFMGLAIVLIVAVPWYVLVHFKTDGAWTQGFFFDHNIDRFSSPKEGHGGNILLPTIFTILTLLPFSIFIPQVVGFVLDKRKESVFLFSAIGVLVPVVFFSIASTKLPSYISPVFPFAALLIGSFLSEKSEKTPAIKFSAIFFFILSITIWFAVYKFLPKEKGMESLTDLHFFFIPLAVGSVVAVIFSILNKNYVSLLAVGFSFIITHQLFFYFAFPKVDNINPVSKTIRMLKDSESIVKYRRMNQAYPWALNRTIENYNDALELNEFLNNNPEAIILTRKKYLKELEELNLEEITREIDIFDNSTTVILKKSN